jgi:hypothetical protein
LPYWFCDRTARTRSFSSARVVDGEPKMGMSRLPKMGYTFYTKLELHWQPKCSR